MTDKGQKLYEYAQNITKDKLLMDTFDGIIRVEAKLENAYKDYQEGDNKYLKRMFEENIQACKDIREILSEVIWR